MNAVTLRSLQGEDYLARSNCEFPEHLATTQILPNENVNVVYKSEREDWRSCPGAWYKSVALYAAPGG